MISKWEKYIKSVTKQRNLKTTKIHEIDEQTQKMKKHIEQIDNENKELYK